MKLFDPKLYAQCRTMVCRNTPPLHEFCDKEEKTILIGYARVSKAQKRAAKMGQGD